VQVLAERGRVGVGVGVGEFRVAAAIQEKQPHPEPHHYSLAVGLLLLVVLEVHPLHPFCFLGVFAFCVFVWQSFYIFMVDKNAVS
jgi:hypothetical protein